MTALGAMEAQLSELIQSLETVRMLISDGQWGSAEFKIEACLSDAMDILGDIANANQCEGR